MTTMTPAEHYREAERMMRAADQMADLHPSKPVVLAIAQVHATLATVRPSLRFPVPTSELSVGDQITVTIRGVVDLIDDYQLLLEVPGIDEPVAVQTATDAGGPLPQVEIIRAGGDR